MDEEQQAVTEITSQRPQAASHTSIMGACKAGERLRLKKTPFYQQQQKERVETQQNQLRQGRSKVPKFNPISHRPQLNLGDQGLVSTINVKVVIDRHHQTHPGLAQDTTLTLVFDGDGPMYKFRLSSSSNLDCLMALLHYTRRLNAFGIRPLFVLGTKSSPMKEDEQNKRAKGRSEQGVKLLDRPSRALLEEAARVSTNDGSSIGFQVFFAAEGIEAERAALSIVKQGKESNDETMIYALVANDADAVAMSGFRSDAPDILCENYFTTTTDVTTTDATTNTDATTSETSETTTPITPTTTPTTPTTTTDASTTTTATKRVLEGRRVESNSKKLKKSKPPGTATAETETTTTTPPTTNNEPGGHRKRAKTSDIPTTPAAHATQPITTTPTSTTSTTTTTTTTTTSTPTPTHKRNLVFQRVNLDSFKEVIVALSLIRIIKTY